MKDIYREALIGLIAGLTYRNGKEIHWKMKDRNITVESAGDDKFAIRLYYENGQIKSKTEYLGNIPHGKHKCWYKNGKIKLKIGFKDGQLDGEWIEYRSEKKMCVSSFKNNMLHGTCLEYYSDGSKKFEAHYIKGKKHGISKCWDYQGRLAYENQYKNGKLTKKGRPTAINLLIFANIHR